jgi:hypothetical protein
VLEVVVVLVCGKEGLLLLLGAPQTPVLNAGRVGASAGKSSEMVVGGLSFGFAFEEDETLGGGAYFS